MTGSLPPGYFDRLYADSDDPWGMGLRWYERRKYALTLAALPRPSYERGFEPGCSIGVLTAQLATRCRALLATDVSERALELAAERVPGNVTLRRLAVPGQWPEGSFDLVVLSELGYYLADVGALCQRSADALTPGGTLLACHWRHPVADYPLRGDEVHAVLAATPGLARLVTHEEEDFRLEVFIRGPAVSVATRTGLV